MAKQLNVNLAFTADTGKAKAQIQDLQNQLTKLVTTTNNQKLSVDLDNKGINEAISSVAELQAHLRKATNQKTGNLDFSKLNDSLKKSNKSLIEYGDSLRQLGPEGQKAFQTLVSSVTSAEIPMRRVNNTLNEMWTTMKNTARWQISSSIMHGFMGSVQSAYGYAKRLDESLNNIRIVTGQNTDQMAAFAEKANKAAKALSATTTQYTDAALIYYQQGLNDQEVQDRADITIKMAHASGQSAEIVSDQLTAIWNNFAKGGEDLEHFADVMTALGAATASSSDEIAGGLEKFASIADMIGLSYEYAASALATITATTRQSEDVVGTALKTIFARIQGLKLGETLDDGTDLNKYSEALQKVGISIFEQNGELKDMDNILAEMGAKWETLSKDQQVALAQTVAGVRQYNQLVSLMDGWDFMLENVELSNNADGTLDEQADIYAESWEAASNRVRAAAEDIYDSLLDDEFFITLLNGFEDVLTVVGKLIDGIGGLEGVFGAVGVVVTKVFSKQLSQSLRDAKYSIRMMVDPEGVEKDRQEFMKDATQVTANPEFTTMADKARSEALKRQIDLQSTYLDNVHKMNDEEQIVNKALIERNKLLNDQKIKMAEIATEADRKSKESKFNIEGMIAQNEMKAASEDQDETEEERKQRIEENIRKHKEEYQKSRKQLGQVYSAKSQLSKKTDFTEDSEEDTNAPEKKVISYKKQAESVKTILEDLNAEMMAINDKSLNDLIEELENSTDSGTKFEIVLDKIKGKLNAIEEQAEETMNNSVGSDPKQVKAIEQDIELLHQQIDSQEHLNEAIENEKAGADAVTDSMNKVKGAQEDWADHIVGTAEAIMSMTAIISSLKATMETLQNPDISAEEKLEAVMMGLITTIPMVISLLNSKTLATGLSMLATKLNAGAIVQEGLAENASIKARAKSIGLLIKEVALRALLNPYIAGAIVLTAGLAFAIKEKMAAEEADAKAAESAKKATEDLKTATEDAKSTLDSIVSDIDQYDNLIQALNDCKEGTEEWDEALQNVKDNIWDILQKYPELAKMDNLFNEDGTLNREVIDGYISQKKDAVNTMRAASLSADARASQAQVVSDTTDLSREFQDFFNQQGKVYSGKQGKYDQGEAQGREFVESTVEKINADDLSLDEINQEVNKYVKSLGLTEEAEAELRAEMTENIDSLYDLAKATREAESQMSNVSKLLAEEVLGGDATEDQKETYSEAYKTNENELYDKYIANKENFNANTGRGNADLSEMWKNAQKSLGIDFELASDAVIGDGDNLSVQYVGADGEVKEMSYEAMAAAAAAGAAQALAEEEIQVEIKEEMGTAGEAVMEGVDTDLLVSLGNTFNFADEQTRQIIATALEGATTLAEQEKIIADFLNNSMSSEERDEMKSKEVVSDASQKYDLDSEVLEEQAKQLYDIYKAEGLTREESAKLAVENQRMNKGVEKLSENWKDWSKELKTSNKGTVGYAKTVNELTKVVADLTGATEDLELPEDFFESEKNLELIGKAAQGSEQAIAELGVAVGKSTVEMMEMSAESMRLGEGTIENPFTMFTTEDFDNAKNIVLEGINELQTQVASGQDLMGQSLDNILSSSGQSAEAWVSSLNEMAMATNMTVDEMNSLMSQLGLEAEVSVTEKEIQSRKPVTRTQIDPSSIIYDDNGNMIQYDTTTSTIRYETIPETIQVAQIGTNGADPGAADIKYIGNGSVSPGSNKSKGGGGGGSKSKPAEKVKYTKKDEVVDRYKEIDDTLSDIEDTMSDINKLSDRLYGASRISQMEKEKKLLLQQADALKAKKLQAEDYMYRTSEIESQKGDKQKLVEIGAKYGITWEFDTDDGDILNYTSAMEGLYNELYAAEVKMDGMATKEAQDEFKTNSIQPIEEKIERIKDALSQYEDTKELLKELDNQLQEAIWAWQDKNFEELEYKLELKLEIEDTFLKELDYLMNKWSDDFFKSAKTAALMYDPDKYDQSDGYRNKLKAYGNQEDELKKQYEAGQISQAKYIEGLKEVQDGYYENLEALNELDKQMLHFYEDTLAAGAEELADYTDHMEHLTGVFDHYLNLMDILGKSKDYEAMGDFLGGRADTLRDRLDVAKEYYDVMLNQKADVEKELNNAIASGDEESIKRWQKQWDAIVDATDEAQEQVLSLTEEWAEAMRATIDNNMAKIKDTLEKSLTDGMGFDFLMAEFDRLNTRQEEYLTKTNQIYETNKLIRQASQKIDETDNKVAKQKMQNFVAETKALQENNQLSNYELEIQQAKYDLLLAEIALEEAQNAKSTVRMQRDSEGNFGYVYTADQDAVNDAQQGVEDAENRLYNLSLEGQQEYTEKYLQAQQEMTEALAEQWSLYYEEGAISLEEYNQRCDSIYEHYLGEGGVFQTYSNLYNVAVQTDAAATADYWGKQYGEMTQRTEEWQVAVNDYMIDVEEQTEEWAKVSKQANKDVEGALKDSSTATKELAQESDKLGRMVENKVIPALEDEYEQVMENVKAYEAERDAIQEVIDTYEKRAIQLGKDIVSESEKALDDEDETITSDSKKFRDDYAADIRDLVLNKGFDIESGAVQSLLTERQEKINSDEKWSGMSNDELIKNIEADKKKKKVTSMDTGGFTGVWGPEGKLAFLHQKELVLNEHDTDNMLNTVSMIRELVSMIDAGAAGSMISGLLSTPGFTNMLNHDFQQHVEIYAEFPDATDHSEIEQAFNNLLNTASQYANRKI